MHIKTVIGIIICFCLVPGIASSDLLGWTIYFSERYSIQLKLPKTWELCITDRGFSATSPNEDMTVHLVGTQDRDEAEDIDFYIDTLLNPLIHQTAWLPIEINGMNGWIHRAEGLYNNQPAKLIQVSVIHEPSYLTFVFLSNSQSYEQNQCILIRILHSILPY